MICAVVVGLVKGPTVRAALLVAGEIAGGAERLHCPYHEEKSGY